MLSSTIRQVQKVFDHPYSFAVVLIIAVLNKFLISYSYYDLLGDKSLYTLMSMNQLEGNGMTETFYTLQNPEQPKYLTNLASNSPGYNWLLTLMLAITGKSFLWSTVLLDVTGWLLIFIAISYILRASGAGRPIINITILLSGLYLFPFETQSPSKDTLATSGLLFATWYVIKVLKNPSIRPLHFVVMAILCIVPGVFKSSYIPLAPVFTFPFFVASLIRKDRRCLKAFAISFTVLVLLVGIYSGWTYSRVMEYRYSYFSLQDMSNGEKGVYLSNLKYMYPFIPVSFVSLELVGSQVESLLGISFARTAFLFQFINWLAIAALVYFLLRSIIARSGNFFSMPASEFYLTAGIVSLALIASVAAMSIIIPLAKYKGGGVWTYVMESRTYFYIMVIVQMTILLFALKQKNKLAIAIVILFALGSVHSLYFSVKSFTKRNEIHLAKERSNYFRQVLTMVDSIQAANPEKKVRLLTEIEHLKWLGVLQGKKVYSGVGQLKDGNTAAPPGFIIITSVFKTDIDSIVRYTSRKDVAILKEDNDRILYVQKSD